MDLAGFLEMEFGNFVKLYAALKKWNETDISLGCSL